MATQEIVAYIQTELDSDFIAMLSGWDTEQRIQAIELYKERVSTLAQLIEELRIVHNGPEDYDKKDYDKWITPQTQHYLEQIIVLLEQSNQSVVSLDQLKSLAKELNIKVVQLMQPLRLALIGKSSGPGVCELIRVVGTQKTIERIRALNTYIQRTS